MSKDRTAGANRFFNLGRPDLNVVQTFRKKLTFSGLKSWFGTASAGAAYATTTAANTASQQTTNTSTVGPVWLISHAKLASQGALCMRELLFVY
jgi:hypothetical protein